MFTFARRESLDPHIEAHNAFSGIEESPRDVVLFINPSMGSEEFDQVPEVCFPFVGLNYLAELLDSANLLPRERLSQRQKSRIPANCAIGRTKTLENYTVRRSTCELWFPTAPAGAQMPGKSR